jgi:hypothetical protein
VSFFLCSFCLKYLAPVTNKPLTACQILHEHRNACRSSCKFPLLPDFNQTWNKCKKFYPNSPTYNFTKFCSAVLELLHIVRRTDMTKATNTFFKLFVVSALTKNVTATNKRRRGIECNVTENFLIEILRSSLRATVRVIQPTYPPTSSKTKVQINWKTLQVVSSTHLDCRAQRV